MLKKIFGFIGKGLIVLSTAIIIIFGASIFVELFAGDVIDNVVTDMTGVEIGDDGYGVYTEKTDNDDIIPTTNEVEVFTDNTKEVDTPIRLDNNSNNVSESRPEPIIPNEVLECEVYITQQMESNGKQYYVMNEVEYINLGIVTPDYSPSPGSIIGLIEADGSVSETGVYPVILEVTNNTISTKSGQGFINELQVYKFSTYENLNKYNDYIGYTNSEEVIDNSNEDININQNYQVGDIIEVDYRQFHIIDHQHWDGYEEVVFGIGDTGPYVSMVWYEENEFVPDFDNISTVKLKVESLNGQAFYNGNYIDTIEFNFVQ